VLPAAANHRCNCLTFPAFQSRSTQPQLGTGKSLCFELSAYVRTAAHPAFANLDILIYVLEMLTCPSSVSHD